MKPLPTKQSHPSQAEKIKQITDKLEQGIADLFSSDRYKTWLTTMSRFHDYSLNNTLLIAGQMPHATLVAGYGAWKKQFGRQVQKGSRAIRILAPSPYKKRTEVDKIDPDTGSVVKNSDGTPQKEIREIVMPAFKVVNVFDVSQTEGKELPTLGVSELSGDVEQYSDFMSALRKTCPVPMEFEEIAGGAKGYFHPLEERIAIQSGMSQVQTVKTAIHEMAHQKLHSIHPKDKTVASEPTDNSRSKLTRNSKEVEAESVAFTVCRHFGIETDDYSFAYIAAWSRGKETHELKASLDVIRKAASEMITEIENCLKALLRDRKPKEISADVNEKDAERGESISVSKQREEEKTSVIAELHSKSETVKSHLATERQLRKNKEETR